MDNAERRNIHARVTCGESAMDRQVPSPGEDDGIGMCGTLRRSGCETLRLVPPRPSRMACNVPNPRTTHPRSVPAAPTRDRNVRRCRELRVLNLGENREEIAPRVGGFSEDGCRQRRPAAFAVVSVRLPEGARGTAPDGQVLPRDRARRDGNGRRTTPDRRRGLKTPPITSARIVPAGLIGVVRPTLYTLESSEESYS